MRSERNTLGPVSACPGTFTISRSPIYSRRYLTNSVMIYISAIHKINSIFVDRHSTKRRRILFANIVTKALIHFASYHRCQVFFIALKHGEPQVLDQLACQNSMHMYLGAVQRCTLTNFKYKQDLPKVEVYF